MISAAGSKPGARFILHYKEIAAIEMAMHFPDFVLINNIGFLNAEKLGRQFFRQSGKGLIGQVFLTIGRINKYIFILRLQVNNIFKAKQDDPVACFYR